MSTKAPAPKRLAFIDSLRGLAVVFMVPLHASHGWVRPAARHGDFWNASQFFGGLAAPIFLTLTGVSLGLQWANAQSRGRTPRFAHDCARGFRLIVLGYLLRLQMWVIDGGGYASPRAYLGQALLLSAYALAYYAVGLLPTRPRPSIAWLAAASLLFAIGLHQVALVVPERAHNLLRVDVLQCIGASLIGLSAIARARGSHFADKRFYLIAALIVAALTSSIRERLPGAIPEAIAAYLGQWQAEPGRAVIGLFPLFPWFAYALEGAALGLFWGRAESEERVDTSAVALCALGAFIALISSESWTPVYRLLRDHVWLIQPLRVVYRMGLVLCLVGIALAARPRFVSESLPPLTVLGRASLLVYWVHLEFAFGAASAPISRRLGMREWALGSLFLLCAMWLLAYVRVVRPRLPFRARDAATG
ncbi:MAG TPA: heparan-alpha-glucosaminide N-acetyltransferase domain-containing protein [Polyangiales bacterium]